MTHLHKHRLSSIFKWVFGDSHRISSFCFNGNNPRFYTNIVQAAHISDKTNHRLSSEGNAQRANRKEAQAALLDYLHFTRNLLFTDAENMSKNSPHFLEKLLEKVGAEEDVGRSVSKYLRYSPINEFEPFFESLGLKPHEYCAILPRDLMFLSDDELFMENYKFLCCCGLERKNMGKIFMVAPEIFWYEYGVLELKLEAYKKLGLTNSFVAKLVECSPCLLVGNVNKDLTEVLEILRKGGIEFSWIEEHLSDKTSYNWSRLHAVLDFLFRMGGSNEEMLACLIRSHPGILFEDSGSSTSLLICFLMKFGFNNSQICSVFQGFPKIPVATFVSNMRRSFQIFSDIDMRVSEMRKMIHSHALLLGSSKLRQSASLLKMLNVGKKRLREFMQENPQELKTLAIGSKVGRRPSVKIQSKLMKTKFLLELGINEPYKIEKALRRFRGSGVEIQERFNCLVETGLDEKDVCEMIRAAPEILNQSMDSIKTKIDFLVNDLGCPVSTLVSCPEYLNYKMQRVKLRFAMFDWLKEQGICNKRSRKLRTVISYSDERFVRWYVKHHPRGLEVWEDLKRTYSTSGGNRKAHYCTDASVLVDTQ